MNVHNRLDLTLDGYRHGAPSAEAEAMDGAEARRMTCQACGAPCRFDAYHRPGSYIALAICVDCGYVEAF